VAPTAAPTAAPTPCAGVACTATLTTAEYGGEISWNIDGGASNTGYGSSQEYTVAVCLSAGSHTMNMIDSFGDGWNGAKISVVGPDGSSFLTDASFTTGKAALATFTVTSPPTPAPTPAPTSAPTPAPMPCQATWDGASIDIRCTPAQEVADEQVAKHVALTALLPAKEP
jgi:hypothetical protein